jgi:septal ring factor EnvC (AmiA/AmiB activator)
VLLDEINAGLQKRSGLLTAAESAIADRQTKIANLRTQATELESAVERLRRMCPLMFPCGCF